MIRVTQEDGVKIVSLDRAEKRNALTPDGLAGLKAELAEAGGDWRVILLRGEGPAFCSGFDLDLCRDDGPEQGVMRGFLNGLGAAIYAARRQYRPVVLAAKGAAVAGGCALLGGADVVVADRGAKLGYPVVRLGVSPAVSAPFLREGVGDGVTRRRLLDSELFSGEEGYRRGLVHELVDDADAVDGRALEIARELAGKPAKALRATKGWIAMIEDPERMKQQASRALGVSASLVTGGEAIDRLARVWKKDGGVRTGKATR